MIKDYPVHFIEIANGERLAYRKAGTAGPVVVLVHGNQSSSLFFAPLMEALEARYQLYAVDLLGFGDSSYGRELTSLQDFSQDLIQWIEAMGIDRLALLGWSTGGGVAMEVAASLPEQISHLILLDSVGVQGFPLFRYDEQFQPILSERVYLREDIAKDPVSVLPVLQAFANNDREFMRSIWTQLMYHIRLPEPAEFERYLDAIFQQRNLVDVVTSLAQFNITDEHNGVVEGSGRYRAIKAPILIIHGEEDRIVPLSFSEQSKALFGEQARLEVLSEAGHSVITDRLDALTGLLEDFVC